MRSTRRTCLTLAAIAGMTGTWSLARADEPSPQRQAALRHAAELRRQRREANRRPIGSIEPWPMPPALIIRQTPAVHDEIRDLLALLRQ